ncbi:MAG: hypothetical protein DWQ06_15055 [Calditrichaeota bacterium]|nr:MAG: hypothetical protein DWQ06_15055 [Calditrichota bacterium]
MRSLVLVLILFANFAFAENLIVVVSKDNPYTDLKLDEINNIYLGKMNHWPKGQRVLAVDLPNSTKAKKLFLENVVEMTPISFEAHWGKIQSSGQAFPLQKFKTTEEVKKYLSENIYAIAYLLESDLDESFKKIKIDGEEVITPLK